MKPEQTYNILRWAGVALIEAVAVLTFTGLFVPAFVVLCFVAGIDLALVYRDEDTISHVWRTIVPRWGDYGVTVLLIPVVWHFCGLPVLMVMVCGWLIGHLFGDW
jgi:hypothetical protein